MYRVLGRAEITESRATTPALSAAFPAALRDAIHQRGGELEYHPHACKENVMVIIQPHRGRARWASVPADSRSSRSR